LVAAAAALVVLAGAAVAARVVTAQGPRTSSKHTVRPACASALLADWADGRIDGIYPIRCYRSALKALPSDLEVYSSAPDDIAQALSQRIIQSRTGPKARRLASVGGAAGGK
jgi:hypothetical protein